MKLLIDQNLSPKLVNNFRDLFPESKHVSNIGLDKSPDTEIWDYAKNNGFIILSKDTDFININALRGFPPKIIWLKHKNCSTFEIIRIVQNSLHYIQNFDKDNNGILILR